MVNFKNIFNITFQICAIRDTTATPIAMNGYCTLCNYLTLKPKAEFLAKLILNMSTPSTSICKNGIVREHTQILFKNVAGYPQ